MRLVRSLAGCRIWSAGIEQFFLVFVDGESERLALFEYDSPSERELDIQLVRNLPDDGAGGGIPILKGTRPPGRSSSAAQALPTTKD
jgi:hypothetical protein